MIWYVSRRDDGTIASAHEEPQEGYATEALDDGAGELAAWFDAARNPVPATATSGDLVSALIDLGWYDSVDAAATAAGGRALALWRHASIFERYNPILIGMGRAIGKTDADLDMLFRKTRGYA